MCVCASTVINSSTVLIILFLSSIVLGLIDEMHGPIVCFLPSFVLQNKIFDKV